jgi:hypothetical protein
MISLNDQEKRMSNMGVTGATKEWGSQKYLYNFN